MANEVNNAVKEAAKWYENTLVEAKAQFEQAVAQGQEQMDKNMAETQALYEKAVAAFTKNQESVQVAANEAFDKALALQAQNMALASQMVEKMQAAWVKESASVLNMTETYLGQVQANNEKFTKLATGLFKLN
ncbi:MAG: hypothetical protein JNN12_06715 [Bacteroidetes Order II. Incertae sedis bacterium]|nr:hypothetical protein [Bacteroidetes Order II. bacterium]